MINELPAPTPTTKKTSVFNKVIGLVVGGVVVIAGISLIASNAEAEKTVTSAVETGAAAGVTGGGATVGEAPDWRNPAAVADKAVDKVEEIQETTTTTETPVVTEQAINQAWWDTTGYDDYDSLYEAMQVVETADATDLEILCAPILVEAQEFKSNLPNTALGTTANAFADPLIIGFSACVREDYTTASDMFDIALENLPPLVDALLTVY